MRWPWLRRGGVVVLPQVSAPADRLPPSAAVTSYAPADPSPCALDLTDSDGLCPYCGASSEDPHLPDRRT